MSRLRGWREVTKRRGRRIRSQSVLKLHALLPIWVCSCLFFATWGRLEVNVPCLENVLLSLLMRRMKMWMLFGAVAQCMVVWILRGLPSESLWAMLFCRTQAGFLILLAFPCLSFFKSHLHSALAFFGRLYIYGPLCNSFWASYIHAHYILKMAPWGCCISVYNSSGEPVGRPECSWANFTAPSGSEIEVCGATSEGEVRKRTSRKGGLVDILESWFSPHIIQFLRSYAFMF